MLTPLQLGGPVSTVVALLGLLLAIVWQIVEIVDAYEKTPAKVPGGDRAAV